ncbi:hypothetical protein B0H14DRAFT_2494727 [Mycena olivaceomarginata]|nr:hypothetical protein B0H14DRAFT_2494727 [Mycena olivaceomarginata]
MVGFAARQFLGARLLSKGEIWTLEDPRFLLEHRWIRLVRAAGSPVVTWEQLRDSTELQQAMRQVDAAEIMNKSKRDALSKGVALAQGLWFTTQCLARVHQHLAVTELKVVTLTFAVVNIFLFWSLWWNKPLDVQRPIVVWSPELPGTQSPTPTRVPRFDRLVIAFFGFLRGEFEHAPVSSTSVPSFWAFPGNPNLQTSTLASSLSSAPSSAPSTVPRGTRISPPQ